MEFLPAASAAWFGFVAGYWAAIYYHRRKLRYYANHIRHLHKSMEAILTEHKKCEDSCALRRHFPPTKGKRRGNWSRKRHAP